MVVHVFTCSEFNIITCEFMNTISFSVVHQISYTNNITEEAYNNYTLVIACLLELFIAGEMSHSITLYFVNFGENMKKHGKT